MTMQNIERLIVLVFILTLIVVLQGCNAIGGGFRGATEGFQQDWQRLQQPPSQEGQNLPSQWQQQGQQGQQYPQLPPHMVQQPQQDTAMQIVRSPDFSAKEKLKVIKLSCNKEVFMAYAMNNTISAKTLKSIKKECPNLQ